MFQVKDQGAAVAVPIKFAPSKYSTLLMLTPVGVLTFTSKRYEAGAAIVPVNEYALVIVTDRGAELTLSVTTVDVLVALLVSPPYTAVRLWAPVVAKLVAKVATPLVTVPVPNVVVPSLKVTVPVAMLVLPVTVAVRVTL